MLYIQHDNDKQHNERNTMRTEHIDRLTDKHDMTVKEYMTRNGLNLEGTGGGCDAWGIELENGTRVLITDGDANAPQEWTDNCTVSFCVGEMAESGLGFELHSVAEICNLNLW